MRKVNKSSHRQICDKPAEKSWQLSKWLLKQSVINIHSSLQNNFLVRHRPVELVGGRAKKPSADGFYFPYWHYCFAHFQFSCRGAKSCLQSIWSSKHLCLCLKNHTGLFPHLFPLLPPKPSTLVRKWVFITVCQVKLIFTTTNSPQLNVRDGWVFLYLSQYMVRAIKWSRA